ncbi:MAG: L,D-transpeptidase [Actinomycetota bacterium]|nr:L,D-transpeptidase [Actinomycetota bacterium]
MKKIIKYIIIASILVVSIIMIFGCFRHDIENNSLNDDYPANSKSQIDNKPYSNNDENPLASDNRFYSEDNIPADADLKTDNEPKNDENSNIQEEADDNTSSSTSTTSNTDIVKNEYTPPKLTLEITEGPVILEDNSLCYYRIKAKVQGNPTPRLSFSKDDSNGAWGKNVAQVNLLVGESCELYVNAANTVGKTSASVSLTWDGGIINKGSTTIVADEVNPSNYLIEVSLSEQKVRVFYKDNLLKEVVCSSGAPQTPTPKGVFKISDKIKYSWLPQYDVGAYYFVRFFKSYLFHSTPFDKDGNLIEEDQKNLGKPVSHGCVRLDINEAKWLYETVPSGTMVKIY